MTIATHVYFVRQGQGPPEPMVVDQGKLLVDFELDRNPVHEEDILTMYLGGGERMLNGILQTCMKIVSTDK